MTTEFNTHPAVGDKFFIHRIEKEFHPEENAAHVHREDCEASARAVATATAGTPSRNCPKPLPIPRKGEAMPIELNKETLSAIRDYHKQIRELKARVAELEDANARMREVIASQPLNSPTRLEAVAEILASVK